MVVLLVIFDGSFITDLMMDEKDDHIWIIKRSEVFTTESKFSMELMRHCLSTFSSLLNYQI